MQFTKENIRYCLLSFAEWEPKHQAEYAGQGLPLSGLFNWSLALKGKRAYPRLQEEFDAFNLIHVNITANNIFLFNDLLKKIDHSKTKTIVNVDYAIDLWGTHFKHPTFLLDTLDKADYIFAVEHTMADALSAMLHRPVACIPHPTDIAGIKNFRTTERTKTIGCFHHVYDANTIVPSMVIDSAIGDDRSWESVAIGGIANEREIGHLYRHFTPYLKNFTEFIANISKLYAAMESYTIRSYGRVTVECAALGVPVIGSSNVESIRHCFPLLSTSYSHVSQSIKLLRQLINDKNFYTQCAQYAVNAAKYYSFDSCVEMMIDFLNSPS